jgi:hypothetical protein
MKPSVNNIALIVEACRQMISDIGTSLDAQSAELPSHLQEATDALSKAHVALLKAETLLKKG